MSVTTRFAGIAASAALAFGAFGATAYADDAPTTDPCAKEQTHVDKATEALAKVTAVFARQQARVEAKQAAVAEADAGNEKAAARHALKAAKDALKETKTTKRAQQQRLAKATERLTACQTPETTEAPAPA